MDADHARWDHGPLDETLHDARALSVSVVDRLLRDGWEQLAALAGIPKRRWRRHHPLQARSRLVALVDGQPALDVAAWERLVSLAPGAVVLPTRTARTFGVARTAVRPPDRRWRLGDLLGARRRRRRLRRLRRDLDAEQARYRHAIDAAAAAALADGDDGSHLAALPTYALAARLEQLVRSAARELLPAAVDLLAVDATMQLVTLLRERGRQPGDALLEAARLQAGGGLDVPSHLESLAAIQLADGAERDQLLDAWRSGLEGWHAMRELVLESPPLRRLDDADLLLLAASAPPRVAPATADPAVGDDDPELVEAIAIARSSTARRESVARDRARWFAAARALTWTLADALAGRGTLDSAGDAFDLELDELLAAARGVTPTGRIAPAAAAADVPGGSGTVVSLAPIELRGIPAASGRAEGPVVVVDAPEPGIDVEGAVLVCRSTDPAWMPLLMRCAALVTERGGPLSHAAIVARELGVPTVVGVRGAREAATASATGLVDGTAGTVVLHPSRDRTGSP